MIRDRETRRRIWPTIFLVIPIDMAIAIGILGILNAVAIASYAPFQFRAKLTEPLMAASHARMELVERLALSGASLDTAAASGTGSTAATMSAHLSGLRTVERRTDQARAEAKGPAAERKGGLVTNRDQAQRALDERQRALEAGGTSTSKYVSSTRILGNAIVVSGTISDRQYDLTLVPAVANEDEPVVYLWLCGRQRLPEGWVSQGSSVPTNLPDYLLPSECRRRRAA